MPKLAKSRRSNILFRDMEANTKIALKRAECEKENWNKLYTMLACVTFYKRKNQ